MKTQNSGLINDEQSLISAKGRFGHSIPVYDDGYGGIWVHRNSLGISGIVRASSWEDAYSICEDEFFPAGDADCAEEVAKGEYATEYMSGRELWLRETGKTWEDFNALSEAEKDAIYRAPGKDVPFDGHFTEHPIWQENYGFRGNSRKEKDGSLSSIYAKDLNGDSLDALTPELLASLEITLEIRSVD